MTPEAVPQGSLSAANTFLGTGVAGSRPVVGQTQEQMAEVQPDIQLAYNDGLLRYLELTRSIRAIETSGGGLEAILEIDKARVALHHRLDEPAINIGKTPQDVLVDRILIEGNLREYGIEAPVLKLPFRAYYYSYDPQDTRIISDQSETPGNQGIKDNDAKGEDSELSYGSMVDPVQQISSTTFGHFQEYKMYGDVNVLVRWAEADYLAIIYAIKEKSTLKSIPEYRSPSIELRRARMMNLARDFDLFTYTTWQNFTHREADTNWTMNGIEVPAERLKEIAQAMAKNPERYWLTEAELSQP